MVFKFSIGDLIHKPYLLLVSKLSGTDVDIVFNLYLNERFQLKTYSRQNFLHDFSLVKFLTPASGLQGYWDPYPIDMEFRPPCMVLSTIGISKPGKLGGQSTDQCPTHLHQLHVCLPSSRQKTRLLYRMSLDFAPLLKHIPFMQYLWRHFAEQVE